MIIYNKSFRPFYDFKVNNIFFKLGLSIWIFTFDFFETTATLNIVTTCDDILNVFMTNVLLEGKLFFVLRS